MSNTDKPHISITRHFKDGIKNVRFLLRDTLFNKKIEKPCKTRIFLSSEAIVLLDAYARI